MPTSRSTGTTGIPLVSSPASTSGVKWSPAVGAAADPVRSAKTV